MGSCGAHPIESVITKFARITITITKFLISKLMFSLRFYHYIFLGGGLIVELDMAVFAFPVLMITIQITTTRARIIIATKVDNTNSLFR